MSKQLFGQASADQIENWKKEIAAKYGDNHKLFAYEVDGKVCYLRSVDRDTYAAAAAKVASAGPNKFNDIIIENIWIGGADEIRKSDSLYYGLIEFVEELMAKKKGSLTTL